MSPGVTLMLIAGTRLGPYEILSALGAGGMGEVYRARDTRLDRAVAVKVIAADLSSSPEQRQRFEREARTVSQLSHPHICALFDVGEQDGRAFLVMELLEGETLANRLVKGALPLDPLRHRNREASRRTIKAWFTASETRERHALTKSGVKRSTSPRRGVPKAAVRRASQKRLPHEGHHREGSRRHFAWRSSIAGGRLTRAAAFSSRTVLFEMVWPARVCRGQPCRTRRRSSVSIRLR